MTDGIQNKSYSYHGVLAFRSKSPAVLSCLSGCTLYLFDSNVKIVFILVELRVLKYRDVTNHKEIFFSLRTDIACGIQK